MKTNPFNLEKRIVLLDKNGNFIHYISQREAGYYLRSLQAKLILKYPPSIHLIVENFEINSNYYRFSKSVIYGNYRVQNPDGQEMFHCDAIKILWYLNRDLIDIVSQEPPIVRLKFTPNGNGHHDDDYYLNPKFNRCVVCGKENNLNRHHVVPCCFRRYMPEEIKDHSYHDVLLLCRNCHENYERHADDLKMELAERHKIKIHPTINYDENMGKAIKNACALIIYGKKIPESRKILLLEQIAKYLEKKEINEEDLLFVSKLNAYKKEDYNFGQVVLNYWNFQEFVEMWRRHFINCMKPEFMPKYWDIKKDCFRNKPKNSN